MRRRRDALDLLDPDRHPSEILVSEEDPCALKYRARSLRDRKPMLSVHQKAQILRRAGIAVPAQAQAQMTGQMDPGHAGATGLHPPTWEEQVEALFARHALERASRSLQQAEAARQSGAPRSS